MTSTAIACGTLLILIGLLGYANGLMTGHASLTALIPTLFGIILGALGFAARAYEGLRRHLMHAAVAIALLGFILIVGDLARVIATVGMSYTAANVSKVSMALVCLLFIVLAVRSFVDARRRPV